MESTLEPLRLLMTQFGRLRLRTRVRLDLPLPGASPYPPLARRKILCITYGDGFFLFAGKYKVGFKFQIRRQWVQDLIEITPAEGVIEPGAKQPTTITLHFNKNRQLKKEITLSGANDVTMSIIETATGAVEEVVTMKTSLRAIFNKYSITPARGINFGPLTYNTTSNPRLFTVSNIGEFDFEFKLFDFAVGLSVAAPTATAATAPPAKGGGKGGAKPAAAPAPPGGELTIGNFKFSPAGGTVPAGETIDIQA